MVKYFVNKNERYRKLFPRALSKLIYNYYPLKLVSFLYSGLFEVFLHYLDREQWNTFSVTTNPKYWGCYIIVSLAPDVRLGEALVWFAQKKYTSISPEVRKNLAHFGRMYTFY